MLDALAGLLELIYWVIKIGGGIVMALVTLFLFIMIASLTVPLYLLGAISPKWASDSMKGLDLDFGNLLSRWQTWVSVAVCNRLSISLSQFLVCL